MEAGSLYGYFPSNLSSLFSISVIRWSWYAVYSVCSGCECAGRCFCAFKCSPCSAGPSASLPHLLHFTINNSKRRQLFICYLLMMRLGGKLYDHLLLPIFPILHCSADVPLCLRHIRLELLKCVALTFNARYLHTSSGHSVAPVKQYHSLCSRCPVLRSCWPQVKVLIPPPKQYVLGKLVGLSILSTHRTVHTPCRGSFSANGRPVNNRPLSNFIYDDYYKTDSVKVCPYSSKFECIDGLTFANHLPLLRRYPLQLAAYFWHGYT